MREFNPRAQVFVYTGYMSHPAFGVDFATGLFLVSPTSEPENDLRFRAVRVLLAKCGLKPLHPTRVVARTYHYCVSEAADDEVSSLGIYATCTDYRDDQGTANAQLISGVEIKDWNEFLSHCSSVSMELIGRSAFALRKTESAVSRYLSLMQRAKSVSPKHAVKESSTAPELSAKAGPALSLLLPCDPRSSYCSDVLSRIRKNSGIRRVSSLWSAYVKRLRRDWAARKDIEPNLVYPFGASSDHDETTIGRLILRIKKLCACYGKKRSDACSAIVLSVAKSTATTARRKQKPRSQSPRGTRVAISCDWATETTLEAYETVPIPDSSLDAATEFGSAGSVWLCFITQPAVVRLRPRGRFPRYPVRSGIRARLFGTLRRNNRES